MEGSKKGIYSVEVERTLKTNNTIPLSGIVYFRKLKKAVCCSQLSRSRYRILIWDISQNSIRKTPIRCITIVPEQSQGGSLKFGEYLETMMWNEDGHFFVYDRGPKLLFCRLLDQFPFFEAEPFSINDDDEEEEDQQEKFAALRMVRISTDHFLCLSYMLNNRSKGLRKKNVGSKDIPLFFCIRSFSESRWVKKFKVYLNIPIRSKNIILKKSSLFPRSIYINTNCKKRSIHMIDYENGKKKFIFNNHERFYITSFEILSLKDRIFEEMDQEESQEYLICCGKFKKMISVFIYSVNMTLTQKVMNVPLKVLSFRNSSPFISSFVYRNRYVCFGRSNGEFRVLEFVKTDENEPKLIFLASNKVTSFGLGENDGISNIDFLDIDNENKEMRTFCSSMNFQSSLRIVKISGISIEVVDEVNELRDGKERVECLLHSTDSFVLEDRNCGIVVQVVIMGSKKLENVYKSFLNM